MNRIVALLLITFSLAGCSAPTSRKDSAPQPKAQAGPPLTVEAVLQWRSKYGDLLGKNRDAAIARYGEPDPHESDAVKLSYYSSEKTDGRGIMFMIDSQTIGETVISDSTIKAVKVFPKEGDQLDVLEVIKKAHLFDFSTGVFRDSARQYFTAETKDKRNAIQFHVSESGVSLAAVIFSSP